jgi:CheY-like chemotaxis protein
MFQNYCYLYVEDDRLSREIMRMIMQNVMEVDKLTIFDDSSDFMNRINALLCQPDMILLDIHVKPHTGFEMLSMLRVDPRFLSTKIIALTASVMNEEVEKLRISGFDGAIAKPLSVQTFPNLIERVLSGEKVWHIA